MPVSFNVSKDMNIIKRFSAMLLCLAAVIPAMAQFSIGPRVGLNVNSLHFDNKLWDTENRAGINAGVQAEFMIPMINFGFDASVMYVHRTSNFDYYTQDVNLSTTEVSENISCDYIEIPINLKYKIGLPVVGKIVTPYIFTGPSFAFRTSKAAIKEFYHAKKSDIAWNFGIGVQLFSHLQIGASYGLGMTKAYEAIDSSHQNAGIEGKNRYWTVTAAYLF